MIPPTPQQRRDLAFALRLQGKTFRQIGKALGVCNVRAREIYSRQRELLLAPGHWTDALSLRTQGVLFNAGLDTMESVEDAIRTGKLAPRRTGTNGKSVRNYGMKSHEELCEFLGLKV